MVHKLTLQHIYAVRNDHIRVLMISPSPQTCIMSLGGEFLKPDLLGILKYTIIFLISSYPPVLSDSSNYLA